MIQATHQGRLACPGRSEQHRKLAAIESQRGRLQRGDAAGKLDADILQCDHNNPLLAPMSDYEK